MPPTGRIASARAVVRALLAAGVLWMLASPFAAGALAAEVPAEAPGPRVLVTTVADTITPVIADHLADAVSRAEDGGYELLVVRLDTPGGLEVSMRDIVQQFLEADVATAVHVSPRGARAASAGAIITFAANVAAMSPGTAIGAATPIQGDGGDAGAKAIEDSRAFAEAVAEARGRNVEFATETVLDARAASASVALDLGAIDLVVGSLDELLTEIDGWELELASGEVVVLDTADAAVDEYEMSTFRRFLQWLADPTLAFLFLSVGTLGIIYELASPGAGAGGVIGVVMILLALFALSVLPVNAVGFLFLALAVALFVAELFAPGIGVFAFLGAGMLLLSALFLFAEEAPGLELQLRAVVPLVIAIAAAVVLAGRLVWRAQRNRPVDPGPQRLVGREATLEQAQGRTGQLRLDGAWWNVRSESEPLEAGTTVRIRRCEGLELVVEPAVDAPAEPAPTGATDEREA